LREPARLVTRPLAELDFAIFEARHGASFVGELDPATAEAIRGAEFAYVADDELTFTAPTPFWQFQNAVADVMANLVQPQADLAAVSDGLWQIERTIWKVLRDAAVNASGAKWRKNLFNLAEGEPLDRIAQFSDAYRGHVDVVTRSLEHGISNGFIYRGCPVEEIRWAFLGYHHVEGAMSVVKELSEIGAADAVSAGGKGANLGELTGAGFPVPGGFTVLREGYWAAMGFSGIREDLARLHAEMRAVADEPRSGWPGARRSCATWSPWRPWAPPRSSAPTRPAPSPATRCPRSRRGRPRARSR
jgi:hypothetical protein